MNKINTNLPKRTMSAIKILLVIAMIPLAQIRSEAVKKWDLMFFIDGNWEKLVVNLKSEHECNREMLNYRTLGFPL